MFTKKNTDAQQSAQNDVEKCNTTAALENFPAYVEAKDKLNRIKADLTAANTALREHVDSAPQYMDKMQEAEALLAGYEVDERPQQVREQAHFAETQQLQKRVRTLEQAKQLAERKLREAQQEAAASIVESQSGEWHKLYTDMVSAVRRVAECEAKIKRKLDANAAAGIQVTPPMPTLKAYMVRPTDRAHVRFLYELPGWGNLDDPGSLISSMLRAATEQGYAK